MCETNELSLIVLTKKPYPPWDHEGISQHALSFWQPMSPQPHHFEVRR